MSHDNYFQLTLKGLNESHLTIFKFEFSKIRQTFPHAVKISRNLTKVNLF